MIRIQSPQRLLCLQLLFCFATVSPLLSFFKSPHIFSWNNPALLFSIVCVGKQADSIACPDSPLTFSSTSGEAAENDHAHIQPLLHPDLAHDANHLQGEHVLAEVIPTLDKEEERLKSTSTPSRRLPNPTAFQTPVAGRNCTSTGGQGAGEGTLPFVPCCVPPPQHSCMNIMVPLLQETPLITN